MKERDEELNGPESKDLNHLEGREVSRRDFLKIAGIAGATIGVGAGLGGLVAACGGTTTTTTTPATTATTSAPASTDTTAAASTTTVSATAEVGRTVKLGCVSPLTGAASAFGIPDKWIRDQWLAAAGDGMVFGDNKKHPVTIEMSDSQSDTNRAAQVAGDLIQNSKIDMMMVSSSPDTVNPVADQCEAQSMPCLSTDCPMEPYYFGRGATPDKPFKWTYLAFWGNWELTSAMKTFLPQLPNNKVVGGVWSNEVDGEARRQALTPWFTQNGYKVVDGGPYQVGTEDYSSMITKFKNAGVQIVSFLGIPPDLTNFWKQALQAQFHPVIADMAKATLFAQSMEAMGKIGFGMAAWSWWHPTLPYKSSLTGEDCPTIASRFEKDTGQQWTQPLMHYVTFEWVVDVLKRTTNLDDKEEIMKAVAATKMTDSMAGVIDFTIPVATNTKHPVPNVVGTEAFYAQWVKATKQYPWDTKQWTYDLVVNENAMAPDIAVQAKLQPIDYASITS
jgi:branched-chain amino acid transport system substrate-binding protein